MRPWLYRICRWLPFFLGILAPALSFARIGGGQHYRSDREPSSRSLPSGGDDLGGLVFYLAALTFQHPGLMCPLLIAGAVVFYLYQRSRNPSASTQKAFEQREADLRTQVSARDVAGW